MKDARTVMTGMSVSSVSATSMTLSELFETYIACSRCCVPFRRIEALGSTMMVGSCGADQSVVHGAVETRLKASMSCSFVNEGSLGRWRPILALFGFKVQASDSSAVREGCVSLARS